jgi:NAD(P)-dependent dehydrogenase (short-subunit alcohol dehydrogenase family)
MGRSTAGRPHGRNSSEVALVTGANKKHRIRSHAGDRERWVRGVCGSAQSAAGREATYKLQSDGLDVWFVELDVNKTETVSAAAAFVLAKDSPHGPHPA